MPIETGSLPQSSVHEIEGVPVACCSQGSGPPVLLAHGIPGDLRTLLPVAAQLSSAFEAITVSLPSSLADERPGRPFGTEGMRDDLIDLVRLLDRGPVHLVAWSYSAHPAIAVALQRPELIRSLFIYEPGFPTFVENAADFEATMADTMTAFGPVAEALERRDRDTALRLAIDGAAGCAGYYDSQPEKLRAIHRDNVTMLEAIFKQSPPVSLSVADLSLIDCPVTVARGSETRPCYRIVSDAAARLIRNASHVVVPDATHLLPERNPDDFAALVRAHVTNAEQVLRSSAPG